MSSIFRFVSVSYLRRLIQSAFMLYCLYIGYQFYLFQLWATGQTGVFTPRPSSVEGFLPISALLGFKQLISTGRYDSIHPAGLTIFLSALLMSLVFKKSFCGWVCPVGLLSNLMAAAGRKLRLHKSPPVWLDYALLCLKYLLLGFFIYGIFFRMNIRQVEAFIKSPYNAVADAKLLLFFLHPSVFLLCAVVFLIVTSMIVRNFWCRYLCPYGALLGIISLLSPFKIARKSDRCVDCKKCSRVCDGSISIHEHRVIINAECSGCMECVDACPVEDCLRLSGPGSMRSGVFLVPAGVLIILLGAWGIASVSGYWDSQIPMQLWKTYYQIILR